MAEINPNNSDEYTIFDVYNPAYKHGGELQIQLLNTYNKNNDTYSLAKTGSKYWMRKNMTGITFRSAVVVS